MLRFSVHKLSLLDPQGSNGNRIVYRLTVISHDSRMVVKNDLDASGEQVSE